MTRKKATSKKIVPAKSLPSSAFEKNIMSGRFRDAVLEGSLVAFDPSSGSANSVPGWSLWEAGQFVAAGTLDIPRSGPLPIRLRALRRAIDENDDLRLATAVAVEQIPSLGGRRWPVQLHKSVAVLQTSVWTDVQIEVPPRTWQKHLPESYSKNDDWDAIGIGWAVVEACFRLSGRTVPEPPWEILEWKS